MWGSGNTANTSSFDVSKHWDTTYKSGEPNGEKHDCVGLFKGQLYDWPCGNIYRYVCQIRENEGEEIYARIIVRSL